MIRTVVGLCVVSTLVFALPAQAQLGGRLGGGLSKGGGESSGGAVPDAAAQERLVKQFIDARLPEMDAQIEFAQAFGLAEQAAALQAQKQALSSGAVDKDALEKSREVGASAQKAIDAKIAEKPALDAEAKSHYTKGLGSLALASVEAKLLTDEAQKFGDAVKNVRGAEALTLASKLSAGMYVTKETPGYIKSLASSTKAAITFAKANDINVPANADALQF